MSYGWVYATILLVAALGILARAWWMERPKRPWWRDPERGDFIDIGHRRWK